MAALAPVSTEWYGQRKREDERQRVPDQQQSEISDNVWLFDEVPPAPL
jgi:hypothetical protein